MICSTVYFLIGMMPSLSVYTRRILILRILREGSFKGGTSDSDNNGMSDVYENFFKLNAADESDAVLYDDTDELNNLAESERWTDPFAPDTDMDWQIIPTATP